MSTVSLSLPNRVTIVAAPTASVLTSFSRTAIAAKNLPAGNRFGFRRGEDKKPRARTDRQFGGS